MPPAITCVGVDKRFGSTVALDRLDLTVLPGQVHAFLGPNGAGKTTTLRLLLGLIRADAGHVRVLDADPWPDPAALHRRMAYVPGEVALWPALTGGEVIDLMCRLRGQTGIGRRDQLVEQFDLDPTRRIRAYSKGNRQKVALICALAADADLYLLDEPTSGLDPLMEAQFRGCIVELREQGRTVLLSSHLLGEAEALADRVSIIRAGRIVESGTLAELRHLTSTRIHARTRQDLAIEPHVATLTALRAIPGVHDVAVDADTVTAQVDDGAMPAFISTIAEAGVLSLESRPPTLEDVFLQHYGPPRP